MKKYILAFLLVLMFVLLYFMVNPATSQLMPKCIFHILTGLDCPACGIQRAVHCFLRGDVVTALRYNYFLLLSIPYLVGVAITTFSDNKLIVKAAEYVQHPVVVKVFLALTLIWWVVRNIPCVQIFCGML